MITLIIIFFIVAPLILFYTAGYRYDFTKKQILQTGVLSIDVEPLDVKVYLNGMFINNSQPVRLSNLTPAIYHLQLKRDGYIDWSKDVVVESKKTTYIKDLTLFKNSVPTKILTNLDKDIVGVYPSSNGYYLIILIEKDNLLEVSLFDNRNSKLTSLVQLSKKEKIQIEWSSFADFAAIAYSNNTQNYLQLVDAANLNVNKIYKLDKPIISFQWKKNASSPTVYVGSQNLITQFDTLQKSVIYNFSTNDSNKLWFVEENSQIVFYNSETKAWLKNNRAYYLETAPDKIIDDNNSRLIYQSGGEIKIVVFDNNTGVSAYKTVASTNLFYNRVTNNWLAWSPWELWTIYDDGFTELLTRNSEKIISVRPLDNTGVLLLSSGSKIMGFNPGYYVNHELLNNATIKIATADIENRKIYFWGKYNKDDSLYMLDY